MASPSGNASASREWILVIDDDQQMRQMVTECLAAEDVEVVGARNAAEAMQILEGRKSGEPVVTLVDVLMPGTDGLTLARKLQDRFKRGTIVVMSGHMTDMSWWPVELREVRFLSKPFRLVELMELVVAARAGFQRE